MDEPNEGGRDDGTPPEDQAPTETPSDQTAGAQGDETPSELESDADRRDDEDDVPEEFRNYPESFKKAARKHGWDLSKLGDHYFETQTQNSQKTKAERERDARIQKLEAELEEERRLARHLARRGGGTEGDELDDEGEPPPEVSEIDSRMQDLHGEVEQLQADIDKAFKTFESLKEDRAVLRRDLKRADPMDKETLEAELERVERQMTTLDVTYRGMKNSMRSTVRELQGLEGERENLLARFEADRSNQERVAKTDAEKREQYRTWALRTIDEAIEVAGVPKAQREYAAEAVLHELTFRMLTETPRAMDDPEARPAHGKIITAAVQKYMKANGIKSVREFKDESRRRQQTTPATPANQRSTTATPAKPKQEQTEESPFAGPRKGFMRGVAERMSRLRAG